MKNILVKAYTGVNLGDDLFLDILRKRYPEVNFSLLTTSRNKVYKSFIHISILSFWESIIRKLISYISLPASRKIQHHAYQRFLKTEIGKYDAFLHIGGSIFMQPKDVITKDNEFVTNLYQSSRNAFVIGANFGPYRSNEYYNLYANAFRHCNSIVFRDKYSFDLFPQLTNSKYTSDIVFQLPPMNVDKIPDSVGISVVNLMFKSHLRHQDQNYITFLVELTESLLQKGKQVYLYSFCKCEGDEITIARVMKKIKNQSLHVVFYDGDIETFLQTYGAMEAMFSSRFHSMILSLVYRQKMMPIIYSKKQTQVLDDIIFSGNLIDLYEVDKINVEEKIQQLYASEYILPDVVRKESELMFNEFDNYINA